MTIQRRGGALPVQPCAGRRTVMTSLPKLPRDFAVPASCCSEAAPIRLLNLLKLRKPVLDLTIGGPFPAARSAAIGQDNLIREADAAPAAFFRCAAPRLGTLFALNPRADPAMSQLILHIL